MAVQPKLHLSPFLLSTVMYDSANSVGDQEGFLIGNAQKCIRREISDQSMYNTEEDLIISISSCVPCGSYLTFYDSCGNVKKSVVEEFLGERKDSVVGWYRYRRNLVAFPSAREMIVHKNLKQLFPGNRFVDEEYFTLGIFGSACYPTIATHTFDYAFFVQKAETFKALGITLLNLGDTKSAYRGGSLSGSFINSSTFDSVLEIPWDFNSCWQTEDAVQQMHKMLREKCDSLAEELAASESVNGIIEQEVQKLTSELENLTIKALEPSEPGTSQEMEQENSGNIPPERMYIPLIGKFPKISGKRNLKDLVDLHNESHPMFGKYFGQNQDQEPGTSSSPLNEVPGINYNLLPPKKKIKVILQERRRILDHDYDNVSDEDPPQQFMPENDEGSSDTYITGNLSSNAAGYLQDEDVKCKKVDNFEAPGPSTSGEKSSKKPHSRSNEEPKVKVVFLDGRKNIPNTPDGGFDANIQCPEYITEEIVESVAEEVVESVAEEVVESVKPDKSNVCEPQSTSVSLSKVTNISKNQDTVPNNGDENKSEPENEPTHSTSGVSSSKERGRPLVIYCKPVNKGDGGSDAAI